jgi:hypothetical protein
LNSCDACYHSVQKVLYRDVKIKIWWTGFIWLRTGTREGLLLTG